MSQEANPTPPPGTPTINDWHFRDDKVITKLVSVNQRDATGLLDIHTQGDIYSGDPRGCCLSPKYCCNSHGRETLFTDIIYCSSD